MGYNRLVLFVFLIIFCGLTYAGCLSQDDRANKCRQQEGDSWCAKHGKGNLFAYSDKCLKNTTSSEPNSQNTEPAKSPPPAITLEDSPQFKRGLSDREAIEQKFSNLTGDYKSGFYYWATTRNDPKKGSCGNFGNFTKGCKDAKATFSPIDALRNSDPNYKQGYSSFKPLQANKPEKCLIIGIKPNSKLELHASDLRNSAITGTIPYNAHGITNTDCTCNRSVQKLLCQISYNGTIGFVDDRFLSPDGETPLAPSSQNQTPPSNSSTESLIPPLSAPVTTSTPSPTPAVEVTTTAPVTPAIVTTKHTPDLYKLTHPAEPVQPISIPSQDTNQSTYTDFYNTISSIIVIVIFLVMLWLLIKFILFTFKKKTKAAKQESTDGESVLSTENKKKSGFWDYYTGFLTSVFGSSSETETSPLTNARNLTMVAVTISSIILFGINEYLDIGIKKQDLDAAKFDSQSVLKANNLTPKEAADRLANGEIITDTNGNILVGKSLVAFTAYLSAQAKAKADIAESEVSAVKAKFAIYQTKMDAWSKCWGAIKVTGLAVYTGIYFEHPLLVCGSIPNSPY